MTNALPAAYDFDSDAPYPPITVVKGVDPDVVREFMRLHFNVVAALPEGKKHFVRPRMHSDVIRHLEEEHAIVAAWSGHKMVGQLLLTRADGHALKNMRDYPFSALLPARDTFTIQAVGVMPEIRGYEWRKGDVATRMLEAACGEAQAQGRQWVLGKTAEDNAGGRRVFEKAGFSQVGDIKQHGTDSYPSVFMARHIPIMQAPKTQSVFGPPQRIVAKGLHA